MKSLLLTAAATVAFAAAPASAVVVTGATEIKVTSAAPNYLQVAELQAFNFGATNVALSGTATSSSIYAAASTPGKAIDGNTGGGYYTDTIFHSQGAGSGEFLDVTFAAASLSSIMIFGRTDCCSERDVYNVAIFNAAGATLYSGTLDASSLATHSATVSFDAATGAVPEPASWMLMIAGFGLVGVGVRSRRRNAVAA